MSTDHLVSKMSQFFGLATADDELYECFGCGQRFELEYYSCPDCGCFRVDRTEWITD